MSSFSQRLVALRKERGETQPDIAKLLGKARSSIQGYESEGKEPNFDSLLILAEHFDVSTDYLLGRSDARHNDDAVFVNDSKAFSASYQALPADLRHSVASAFDAVYCLLSRDMKLRRGQRLALYQELFMLLQKCRAEIRSKVDNGSPTDPLYLSDLMASQSSFKNEVSLLLDQLLQADMEAAAGGAKKNGGAASGRRSAM